MKFYEFLHTGKNIFSSGNYKTIKIILPRTKYQDEIADWWLQRDLNSQAFSL